MRVLWLSHFLPYPATGHGALQRSHHLLMRTATSHETGVIAIARADSAENVKWIAEARSELGPRLAFLDLVTRSGAALRIKQARALSASLLGGGSYWEHLLHDKQMLDLLSGRIRDFQPDVVLADTLFLARSFAHLGDIPLAVTHHNLESALLVQRARASSTPLRRFWMSEARKVDLLEGIVAKRAQLNVMVSSADAQRLVVAFPGSPTVTVPNGVDTDYFCPDLSVTITPRSLVFAGGMDWYPNRIAMTWCAEKLWPALVDDDPRRTLTVVGRNPPAAVRRLALADARFRSTGFVTDVRPYLRSAATYICPIHVGGGTRLKILDALAIGRPLVSTAVGVSGLGLEEGVHYLRAETIAEFVDQTRLLEEHPELGRGLAVAGRSFVARNYSWETISRGLINALDSVRRVVPRLGPSAS